LKNARLVNSRKQGRWMYYRLADDERTPDQIIEALDWTVRSIAQTNQFVSDNERIEEILLIDPEILCSQQNRSGACETGD
jgi:DNA-binding transcriptional ArsR family regulator